MKLLKSYAEIKETLPVLSLFHLPEVINRWKTPSMETMPRLTRDGFRIYNPEFNTCESKKWLQAQ